MAAKRLVVVGWAISRKRLGRTTRGGNGFGLYEFGLYTPRKIGRSILFLVNYVILSKGWS